MSRVSSFSDIEFIVFTSDKLTRTNYCNAALACIFAFSIDCIKSCEALPTAEGAVGMKMVEHLPPEPISFNVSKYWVISTMFITSLALVPLTDSPNSCTASRDHQRLLYAAWPHPH